MKFPVKAGNGPLNKWLNFGGDPCHCLRIGIVFLIRRYWEIREVVKGHKATAASIHSLWPPCVADANIIFLSCFYLLLSIFLSSSNHSGRRLDVYNTSTHGVALVRI